MRKHLGILLTIAFLALTCGAAPSSAAISIAGMSFHDDAFADSLMAYGGNWWTAPTTSSLAKALLGSDTDDYAYSDWPAAGTGWADLGFTKRAIQNGTGADLAVFELSGSGGPGSTGCLVTLSVNGITNTYTPYWYEGAKYVAKIDLGDFGIATGALVSQIKILTAPSDPDYAAFGAINSAPVPLPAGLLFLGPGLAALAALRRRLTR